MDLMGFIILIGLFGFCGYIVYVGQKQNNSSKKNSNEINNIVNDSTTISKNESLELKYIKQIAEDVRYFKSVANLYIVLTVIGLILYISALCNQ